MLILGFEDQIIDKNSQIVKDIQQYNLGGVILFDRQYFDRNKTKNIASPTQLQTLTSQLRSFSKKPLMICVDQEGGKVARLKPRDGFYKPDSAQQIAKKGLTKAYEEYAKEAKELHRLGINCDFAPVVDLAVNPKNKVIVGLERSYGKNTDTVTEYAKAYLDELNKQNVLGVLKHFPGHGSSLGDSHKGFVDVTNTWSEKELQPYKNLIDSDMIMTAHVFNKHLDPLYPATLSYATNTGLLRNKLGFKGVIVSDDMQMGAIKANYTLRKALTLAINSGIDMILIGNQLASYKTKDIIDTIYEQVKEDKIPLALIKKANERIEDLFTKNSIIQKPIKFTKKRVNLTKEYIKHHYTLDVSNIRIDPKMIVLHWTAVMGLNDSFSRFKHETLFSDRKDIAKGGNLNVSSHFLIDRNGTIYQLMPENHMARHVIGLNHSSIGIENVGGEANKKEDLTPAQLRSNIALVKYLKHKYPSIEYLIGHYEYTRFENSPLWLEKDDSYRTIKADPGEKFMKAVRQNVKDLGLKGAN